MTGTPRTWGSTVASCVARVMRRFALPCLLWAMLSQSANAQNVYPTPNLTSLVPPGAKVGSTLEVTLLGNDFEEPSALIANHGGIKAEYLPPPPPDPKVKNPPPAPLKFKLTVAADVPVGIYEVRFVGKWGVSNPRAFAIGDLNEMEEQEPNSDVPQAQKVEINTIVNGAINPNVDVDYFTFTGKKGEQIVMHCAGSSIDSRLDPQLELFDSAGRLITTNRNYNERDALICRALPADGEYFLRVSQFTYIGGGTDFYYRLRIAATPWIDAVYPPVIEPGKTASILLLGRNLPGGQPVAAPARVGALQQASASIAAPADGITNWSLDYRGTLQPRSGSLNGFEYRVKAGPGSSNPVLVGYATAPVVLEAADNDSEEKPQPITLPCEVCGRVEKRADRDWYTFNAKKGEILALEGYADRLESPIDLYFIVRRADNKQVLGEFDEHTAIPSAVGPFYTRTEDPVARITIPEDGAYQVMVSSRTADIVGDPRYVYRLRIAPEEPDFHILLVGNNSLGAGGCTIRQGGCQDLQVACFRRDNFDAEIKLTVEGLPPQITCPPQTLAGKQKETALVLIAAKDAPAWTGQLKIKGTAVVDGKPIVREARAGCIVWPAPQNSMGISRLADGLYLAVRDKGPFRLDVAEKAMTVPVGGQAKVKVLIERFDPEFKVNVQLLRIAAPVATNGAMINTPNVNLANGKNDAEITFNVPNNVVPGVYTLAFRGTATYPFSKDPKGRKANVAVQEVTPPITFTVYDSVADVALGPNSVAIPPGGEGVVAVKVTRLFGFKGAFTAQLVPPGGFPVTAAQITIPAGASEGKLILKVPANAKPASSPGFKVRLTATDSGRTFTTEIPLTVAISSTATAAGEFKTTKLLEAGALGWKYIEASKVQGDAWKKADFNDGPWSTAKAPLGNGEDEINTRKGTTLSPTGVPFVCRRVVEVPADVAGAKDVAFRLMVASDNSAEVYINGELADKDEGDHEFMYWNRDVELKAGLLKPGKNVIAVLVNNTSGSSDIYLDMEITALVPQPKK